MIALVLALAASSAALPPLPPFPSEVRPRDGSVAPSNAVIFALGDPAPPVAQVGIAATADGAPLTVGPLEPLGCCAITAAVSAPGAGQTVQMSLSSAQGDVSASWLVGPADVTPPVFDGPIAVVDHGPRQGGYAIVVGPIVTDDTQVGAIVARHAGAIVGVAADGYLLTARLPLVPTAEVCLELTALDVAQNESAPATLCVTPLPPAEGEGEGEGEGEPPPTGCGSFAAPAPLALLALGVRGARRRPDAPPRPRRG
jgi:hypothetical protein